MKTPSHIWFNNTDIYFDVLIINTEYCESVFTPYGDVVHCIQTAVRHNNEWANTHIVKHCGELEGLLEIADEILAIKDGSVVFHSV